MNKYLTIFLFLFSLTSFAQQKMYSTINCSENFFVMYRDIAYDKEFSPDKYYIGFEGGFNDTLEVYLNGILISRGLYKTDPTLGSAGAKILFKVNNKLIPNVLLVKSTSLNRCLEFSFDTRFKIVYIDFEEGKWGVSFSNKFTIYE